MKVSCWESGNVGRSTQPNGNQGFASGTPNMIRYGPASKRALPKTIEGAQVLNKALKQGTPTMTQEDSILS